MLTQEQLVDYFEQRLSPNARAQVERLLADDPAAQLTLADQENLDLALRVALGSPAAHARVRESIFTVLRGAPDAELTAGILEEVRTTQAVGDTPAGIAGDRNRWRGFMDVVGHWRFLAGRLAAVTAVVALLGIAVGIWLSGLGRTPAPGLQVGSLDVVVGAPTIRRAGERRAIDAAHGTLIRLGDRIETGDADRAEIRFIDGTTLRLAFNTAVILPSPQSTILNLESAILRPPEIDLLHGQLWTKVQKTANAPQYAIRTAVATAIARGTEFGVKLQSGSPSTTPNLSLVTPQLFTPPPFTPNLSPPSPLTAVLTVKEGAVDFTNALGSVQATAMTESTATTDSAPTEPKRLQTLQVVQLDASTTWSLITSPLDAPEAAERLAGGGGWAGLVARNFPAATPTTSPRSTGEVRIARVFPGSPADRAGLKPGDIVTAQDGAAVTNASQVHRAPLLGDGAATTLAIRRAEETLTVALVPELRPSMLAGPPLTPDQAAQLAAISRQRSPAMDATARGAPAWDVGKAAARDLRRSSELRAAAENNLGVLLELEDALGPAIRAYGRAATADSSVPLYHFNLGLALRKIGSFERAADELAAAVRLAPDSTPARKRLAEIHSLLGQHSAGLAQTEAALQADPRDHGLWELKCQLLGKLRRPAEAVEAARQAVALDPTCPTAHDYLGGALHSVGNLVEAEAACREAIELAPFEALLHFGLGNVLTDRGQFPAAEESLRRAIELQPDFVLAYQNLGRVLTDRRQFAEADATLRRAAELAPDDFTIIRERGTVASRQGRLDEAEAFFRQVLTATPHDAEAHRSLGWVLARRGDLPEAERLLRRAVELEPNTAGFHNDLGEVLRERGQLDAAVLCYRRATELDPDDPSPRNNLAIILAMRGQFPEAEKEFRALVDLASRNPRIYPLNFLVNLAMVCNRQGKLDEAEKSYRQALTLAPDDPDLWNSIAWFLADHSLKLDEALGFARRAVQAAPDNPSFLDTLGWTLFKRGELEEAEQVLQKAVDRAGERPAATQIREHLRQAKEKLGGTP